MQAFGEFLASVLQPLNSLLITIALVLMVAAVVILAMELSGWTITRHGLVHNNHRWNATSVSLAAVIAAFYIAGGMFQIAPIVPGFATWTPVRAFPPILASLFGLPAVIGITFSMPISDALAGKLTLGSVAGCLAHFLAIGWIPYKLVGDPSFRSLKSALQFWGCGAVLGGLLQAIIIPGWQSFMSLLPPQVAWSAVVSAILLNHLVGALVLGPLVLLPLYPRVKAMGLYWKDRYQPDGSAPASGSRPKAAATV